MRTPLGQVLIRLSDAVGNAHSLADICDAALDGVREVTGIDRASILLFDEDGVMRFKAWAGISPAYRRAVEGHSPWVAGEAPPAEPIVVTDVHTEPTLAGYAATFVAENIGSLAFIPIVSRRRVIGKFMLYRSEPSAFAGGELAGATAMGYQIGFAVERMRFELQIEQALATEASVRERLTLLTRGAPRLFTSPSADSAVGEVMALARAVVTADGYAVWRRRGDEWHVAASHGLGPAFAATVLPHHPGLNFDEPVIAADVAGPALLEGRRDEYAREGISSLMSIPLLIRGATGGAVAFYYRRRHQPDDIELRVATALGQLAAAAISNADMYAEQQQRRRDAQEAETRSRFLAEASALMSSLDYETSLQRVAALAVPDLADWCAVDLLTEDQEIARIAVAHIDPSQVAVAHEIHRRYPPRLSDALGIGLALRSGVSQLYPEIPAETAAASARDAEHLRMIRDLKLQSVMIVPLSSARGIFGAITFVTAAGGRRFDARDLEFASELGRRAALAVENARLYRDAQDANRLKDEFLATLSHELRTPLNVILGRTRRLPEAATQPDTFRHAVDTIERNAQALARLVEDLLDVSRFTLGQVTLDTQVMDFASVVAAVATGVEPTARNKGVAVRVDVRNPSLLLVGDATRLQQVAWNLVNNAVKFTPGGGEVTMTLERLVSDIRLTVRDTGEGIAPEFLPHVFDMFRQAESTGSRQHGGLGLGLSIVRRLVELHGGTVAAESAGRGCGATFTVTLPCTGAERLPARVERAVPSADGVSN